MGANPRMDGAADELRLRHAAMLLRLQTNRERLSRPGVLRADRLLAAAMAATAAAQRDAEQNAAANAQRLRAAHEAFRGQVIGLAQLYALLAIERQSKTEAIAMDQRLKEVRDAAGRCHQARQLAEGAAQLERGKQQRKQAVVERATLTWQRAMDRAEEAEFEAQAGVSLLTASAA